MSERINIGVRPQTGWEVRNLEDDKIAARIRRQMIESGQLRPDPNWDYQYNQWPHMSRMAARNLKLKLIKLGLIIPEGNTF